MNVIFDEDDTKTERGAKWVVTISVFVVILCCALMMLGVTVVAFTSGFKDSPKAACCQCPAEK